MAGADVFPYGFGVAFADSRRLIYVIGFHGLPRCFIHCIEGVLQQQRQPPNCRIAFNTRLKYQKIAPVDIKQQAEITLPVCFDWNKAVVRILFVRRREQPTYFHGNNLYS